MSTELVFLRLEGAPLDLFRDLKTERALQKHGPLKLMERVPAHTHQDEGVVRALYLVEGSALFQGLVESFPLGDDWPHNAVILSGEYPHAWLGLQDGTCIPHVLDMPGENNIDRVRCAA